MHKQMSVNKQLRSPYLQIRLGAPWVVSLDLFKGKHRMKSPSKIGQYPRRPTQSETVPPFVEQFHNSWIGVPKMWNSSSKSGTGAESGSLFHKLRNNSTIYGTAPPKSGTGTINSDESHK